MAGTLDEDVSGTLDKGQAGAQNWHEPVLLIGDLPTVGNEDGDVRLVMSTDVMYAWDVGTSTWKQLTTGGTPGDMTKAVYDPDDDGIVVAADSAEKSKNVYVLVGGTPGTDCDYATIAAAATYLRGNPGDRGVILLSPGIHVVSTSIDMTGMTIIGNATSSVPIIRAATGGVIIASGGRFFNVDIEVPAGFAGNFLFDNTVSGEWVRFHHCDFRPATGKAIHGSSIGGLNFSLSNFDCKQTDQAGLILHAASTYGTLSIQLHDTASVVSLTESMKFGSRPVTVDGWNSRYHTTGVITPRAGNLLTVAPGENIQARLDSLSAGGKCIILPGLHPITDSLLMSNNYVTLEGKGEADIQVLVATWVGGTTVNDAVINMGANDGTAPVDSCTIQNIHISCEPNIHGIQVNGGAGNCVKRCHVESTALKSSARTGIVFTDSVAALGKGFVCSGNLVASPTSAERWIDGIHMDGAAPFAGATFGYGNGIQDSVMSENIVEFIHETCYVITSCLYCSIFTNRARDVCFASGAIGLAILNCTDCQVISNSVAGCNVANADGCYIYGSSGVQFTENSLAGIANVFNPGINVLSNSDDNLIRNNTFRDCTVGILIAAGCDRNRLGGNKYISAVTTNITDSGTDTEYTGKVISGSGSPDTVVTGQFGDRFYDTVGTQWYMCTSKPQGTSWTAI